MQAGQSWLKIGNSSNSCGGGREVSHKIARSEPAAAAVAKFCKNYGEELLVTKQNILHYYLRFVIRPIREGFQCQELPKSWHCQDWLNPHPPILAHWWIWRQKVPKCDSRQSIKCG